jgi:epoxide hydrolase-like predicted phosphatase
MWDYVRNELKLSPAEHPDLQQRFFDGDVLDSQLIEYIRTLKSRYKIGIISNAWNELPAAIEELGISDVFDVIVGSGDEGVMKPDPLIYQIALERLAVKPEEAIFVDDFPENIRGAKDLGIKGVHFRSREQTIQEVNILIEN